MNSTQDWRRRPVAQGSAQWMRENGNTDEELATLGSLSPAAVLQSPGRSNLREMGHFGSQFWMDTVVV